MISARAGEIPRQVRPEQYGIRRARFPPPLTAAPRRRSPSRSPPASAGWACRDSGTTRAALIPASMLFLDCLCDRQQAGTQASTLPKRVAVRFTTNLTRRFSSTREQPVPPLMHKCFLAFSPPSTRPDPDLSASPPLLSGSLAHTPSGRHQAIPPSLHHQLSSVDRFPGQIVRSNTSSKGSSPAMQMVKETWSGHISVRNH